MKAFLILIVLGSFMVATAQNSSISLRDLAVPASPAFIILDATPSLVQSPNTPKAFILGIMQSFEQSGGSFPQEYSAEFTPYWWINPSGKSIYKLSGLKNSGELSVHPGNIENIFSGLRFITVSTGFFNKDMIPDTINATQKIVSAGFRSTLIKIHNKRYASALQQEIRKWHTAAQTEMDENMDLLTEISRHPEKADELRSKFTPSKTQEITKTINELINQKPVFAWDFAGAFAMYAIGDTAWKTGRYGIWTTMSSYLPINQPINEANNYLNLNCSFRLITDNYHANNDGSTGNKTLLDAGGKIAYETEQFSFGFESVYRFSGVSSDIQNRSVGLFNYKIAENLYLNAAFGKNFGFQGKLITLFGINWGFGSEKINLSDK